MPNAEERLTRAVKRLDEARKLLFTYAAYEELEEARSPTSSVSRKRSLGPR
jgi:hypothetical protein